MQRLLRVGPLALVVSLLAACANNVAVSVTVIAPDGSDPFVGPDAASQVRITLENDAGMSTLQSVAANGEFRIDIRPQSVDEISRLRIEALRDNVVIATGVTPATQWSVAGGALAVLMQAPDSVVAAPSRWATARADCQLIPLAGGTTVGIFTTPTTTQEGLADFYDVLRHGRYSIPQIIPAGFDGDSTVVSAGENVFIVRGAAAVGFDRDYMTNPRTPTLDGRLPAERAAQAIVRSTGYQDGSGGAWLFGGRDGDGMPSARVDHVSSSTFAFDGIAGTLAVARVAPQIVLLARYETAPTQPALLLYGGNAADQSSFEVYTPGVPTGGAVFDLGADSHRTGAAITCIASSSTNSTTGCTRVAVIGGMLGGVPTADDFVIDVTSLRTSPNDPPRIVARGTWFTPRRIGARATLAEGGVLVLTGGTDSSGASVTDIASLDVHDVNAITTGHVVGTSCANPATLSLVNGSVMIAGGTHPDGTACSDIAFFRH